MAPPYLVISDGTTTITIQDGAAGLTNYPLERGHWAPAVAPRRIAQIGGRGPYEDVAEEMTLAVTDTTAAGVYSRVQTLNDLLDQAERWAIGESATAVLLKYSPGGSTISSSANPFQVAILGRAPGDQSHMVDLPKEWTDGGVTFYMTPVTIRFWRHGQWLRTTDSGNASGTSSAKISITGMTAHNRLSPFVLNTDNLSQSATSARMNGGILLMNSTATLIDVQNAAAITLSSGISAVASTTASFPAGGGNVARTSASPAIAYWAPPTALRTRKVAVFAMVCQTVDTDTWQIDSVASPGIGTGTPDFTAPMPPVVFRAASAIPFPIFIGSYSPGFSVGRVTLTITRLAGTGQLEIDIVVLIAVDDPTTAVIAMGASPNTYAIDRRIFGAVSNSLRLDHRLLTNPDPVLVHRDDTAANGDLGLPTRGDLIAQQKGTAHTLLWLIGAQSNAGNRWRVQNSADAAAQSNTWTLTRSRAYLTPE